jgi:hypothetical protein
MSLKNGRPTKIWALIIAGMVGLMIVVLWVLNQPPSLSWPSPKSLPNQSPSTSSNQESLAETKIVIAGQGGSGCEVEEKNAQVTVAKFGGKDIFEAYQKGVFLTDQQGATHQYYLDVDSLPESSKLQLPQLFTLGRSLDIQYVVCGSGGLRFLTVIHFLPHQKELLRRHSDQTSIAIKVDRGIAAISAFPESSFIQVESSAKLFHGNRQMVFDGGIPPFSQAAVSNP